MPLIRRDLFGGAMEIQMPGRLMDISEFRPVPDHQEVFADGNTDQSLLVEVMEHSRIAAESPTAAEFYFRDLAVANEAQDVAVHSSARLRTDDLPGLPPELSKSIAMGQQRVSKGRQGSDAANLVQLIVAVVQMPQVNSDLVVSLNTPQYISEKSAAAEHAGSGFKGHQLEAPELFKCMLQTLAIKDWGLFKPHN